MNTLGFGKAAIEPTKYLPDYPQDNTFGVHMISATEVTTHGAPASPVVACKAMDEKSPMKRGTWHRGRYGNG